MNFVKLFSPSKLKIFLTIVIFFIVNLISVHFRQIWSCFPCCTQNYGKPLMFLEGFYDNRAKCMSSPNFSESTYYRFLFTPLIVDIVFFYLISSILSFIILRIKKSK